MKRLIIFLIPIFLLSISVASAQTLRIIAFGAHPDDCEINCSGVAYKWAQLGHKVKFVSVTNGDIGHSIEAGGPLAQRRAKEVQEAARILGIETEVLDNHDGELMPTLEIRKDIIRLIREWNADLVLVNRPNDYHPDHRYTSILVQDAAYMVTVPFICPDIPHLDKNPVFMYWGDRFQKPNPFEPNILIAIDDVVDKKYAALDKMPSQFYEGGANGGGDAGKFVQGTDAEKLEWLQGRFEPRFRMKDQWRPLLEEYYGKETAAKVKYVEAFELCEYGRQPDRAGLKALFPFYEE